MSRKGAKDGAAAYVLYQQKRRNLALERQKQSRQDKLQDVRSLALSAPQAAETAVTPEQDAEMREGSQMQHRRDAGASSSSSSKQLPEETQLYGMDGIDPKTLSGNTLKAYFARQLMQPEWMSDIPTDMSSAWLAMPRPEGKRCLVISTGGWTFSRSRTGAILHRFHSRLPGGGPHSMSGHTGHTILDCIFQEHEHHQQQQQQQQHQTQLQQEQQRHPLHQQQGVSQQQQQQQQQPHLQQQGASQQQQSAPKQQQQHWQPHQQLASVLDASVSQAASGDGGWPEDCSTAAVGPTGTYYIQDVLAWRNYSLVDCGVEFRLFWLRSKLAEEEDGQWRLDGGSEGPGHQHTFQLLPYWKASPQGLAAAAGYAANATAAAITAHSGLSLSLFCPLVQDGVYFRHKEGHYELGGRTTPLALLWKDDSCSRYCLDTDAAGEVPEYQQLVLEYQGPNTADVATADDPPVVLGRLPLEFVYQMGNKLRAGRLLRFSIREGGMFFNTDGSPAGADLAYEGPANQRRGRADLISKIMFQWQARQSPLKLEALVAAAAGSLDQPDLAEGDGAADSVPAAVAAVVDAVMR